MLKYKAIIIFSLIGLIIGFFVGGNIGWHWPDMGTFFFSGNLHEWVTAIGTICATFVAVYIAQRQSKESGLRSRENITIQMLERFSSLLNTIEYQGERGAEALKKLWFHVEVKNNTYEGLKRTVEWDAINSYSNETHENVLKVIDNFYNSNMRLGILKGDFETLTNDYLTILDFCPDILKPVVIKMHPREMAFLCFMICVKRKDKDMAQEIIKHDVLERGLKQEILPANSRDIIQKIASANISA